MKLTVFSDIHLGDWPMFGKVDPATGLNTRFLVGLKVLRTVLQDGVKSGTTLFCGDLFESGSRLYPQHIITINELLRSVKGQTFFLTGQHDYASAGGRFNAVRVFDKNVCCLDDVSISSIGHGHFIIACPNAKKMEDQLDMFKRARRYVEHESWREYKYRIFMGHFLVNELLEEAGMPRLPNAVPFSKLPEADVYFMGDFHHPVDLNIGGKMVFSLGSIMHTKFSDAPRDDRGRYIVWDTETNTYESIELEDNPRFVIVEDASEFPSSYKVRDYHHVICDSEEEIDDLLQNVGSQWNFITSLREEGKQYNNPEVVESEVFGPLADPSAVIHRYCEDIERVDMVESGLSYLGRMVGQ